MSTSRPRRDARPRAFADTPWWHSLAMVAAVLVVAVAIAIASRGGGTPGTRAGEGAAPTATPAGVAVALGLTASETPTAAAPTGEPTAEPTATAEATREPLRDGAPMSGVVVDEDGEPIVEAVVRVKTDLVVTDEDGRFSLPYTKGTRRITVSASGYADRDIRPAKRLKVTLERFEVKGVYLNGTAAGYDDVVDAMIDLIDETDLNAIVIDIKDGLVYYDSEVAFFQDADMVRPTYDAAALVERLHEHDIYVIARQVVFKDPLVAEAHPDMAIRDEETGKLWRGWAGEAWVNPLESGLYEPNVDLAVEAAKLGFDEIQYDYIRFPDGDLSGADFGKRYDDAENRVGALTTILSMTREALRPVGAKLSADVFGWMLLVDDDQGIGQRLPDIAAVVDYISPMVYPSHFPDGSIAVDGPPNDFPYETVEISLSLGMAKIPGAELKVRPWLQDFTLTEDEYGVSEIRAQIRAAEEVGASGYLMWNIDANYVRDAYES